MFRAKIEEDKTFDKKQTHYYLTQGDSCVIYATPYKDGEKLPLDYVERCVFKLSNDANILEFEKELVLEGEKFVLRLTHEETTEFTVEDHTYEIEYTLIGGAVQTPNRWTFTIEDQIIR